MALVSGNRSAQDRLWRHQSGSRAVGSGLENGSARGQRAQGRASEGRREDSPSRRWEEEGHAEGSDLATGFGRVTGAQRGSDEPGQMDDTLAGAPGQGACSAGTSYQEDGPGRLAA